MKLDITFGGAGGSKVCAQKDLNEGRVQQSLQVYRRSRLSAGRESNRRSDCWQLIALPLDQRLLYYTSGSHCL